MEEMQKTVQQQVIVRLFQPDMPTLKSVAKQVSEKPGLKLALYGQAGEALVVIAAQTAGQAAGTELLDRASSFVERKMGECAYGRGKESMAHHVAKTMIEEECTVIAADPETGALLEAEFSTTKHGDKVFDFGQASYRNTRMAAKINDTALMDDEETNDPLQQAADRSYAAAKCTRAEFGAAITGVAGGEAVFVAVTHRGTVYIRAIRPSKDAGKTAALTVLDIMRRILQGMTVPYARTFKAGREIDWNAPTQQKASGAPGGKKTNMIVPIVALVLVAIALGVGIWFIYNTFFIKDNANVPAGGNTTSQSASSPATDPAVSTPPEGDPAASTPAEGDVPPADSGATDPGSAPASQGQANTTGGAVHPFT